MYTTLKNPILNDVSRDGRKLDPSQEQEQEPSVCEIVNDYTHPSILLPNALINASTGLVAALSYVFALQLNGIIEHMIDNTSHHQVGMAALISFLAFILVSYIGSMFIEIGKKMKYDMHRKYKQHKFNFDQ